MFPSAKNLGDRTPLSQATIGGLVRQRNSNFRDQSRKNRGFVSASRSAADEPNGHTIPDRPPYVTANLRERRLLFAKEPDATSPENQDFDLYIKLNTIQSETENIVNAKIHRRQCKWNTRPEELPILPNLTSLACDKIWDPFKTSIRGTAERLLKSFVSCRCAVSAQGPAPDGAK